MFSEIKDIDQASEELINFIDSLEEAQQRKLRRRAEEILRKDYETFLHVSIGLIQAHKIKYLDLPSF